MTLRRNDLLIKRARAKSLNTEFSETEGVPDSFFVDALREAVFELQKYLVDERCDAFSTFADLAITGADYYEPPDDIFINTLIYEVWFSADSSEKGFGDEPLTPIVRREFGVEGYPEYVCIDNGKMFLIPKPSWGKLRIRYEQKTESPDIRRGTVEYVTQTDRVITSLGVDVGTVPSDTDFDMEQYICIVDAYGTIKARGVRLVNYDNGDFQCDPSQTFSTTINVGDFVVCGKNSTTHLNLPDFVEPYLIEYMVQQALQIDSSTDQQDQSPLLERMLGKIASLYSAVPGGRYGIPEIRRSW